MATSQFIGLRMAVTMRDPPGMKVKGTVSEVSAGNSLTLVNVFVTGPETKWLPRLELEAINILDLNELQDDISEPSSLPTPTAGTDPIPKFPQPAAFQDSAILSAASQSTWKASVPGNNTKTHTNLNEKADPQLGQPGVLPPLHLTAEKPRSRTSDTLVGEMSGVGLEATSPVYQEHAEADDLTQVQNFKKKRRPKTRNPQKPGYLPEASPGRNTPPANRGKGWRETPMLESTSSFQPFTALKKASSRGMRKDMQNGWASEEVTEEMAEFDFETENAKFDKRTLFDQMRKEDLVDESDRLVSHNRRPKPGTAGGKNLHYTENVLDTPTALDRSSHDFWNSEADDGLNVEERAGGRDLRSAQSNRRADSKPAATRRSQSRKASATTVPLARTNSMRPDVQPGFYLLPLNRRIETVSALQMLNLENIAANEIGLTEDMMTENAARGIAEVSLMALVDPGIQVQLDLTRAKTSSGRSATRSTIAILAGNNKTGTRAVAAGRHLRSKGVYVIICLVGIEREQDLLDDLRQQIRIYRNLGGKVFSKQEFFEQTRPAANSDSPTTTTLIIDALLGLTLSFDELRMVDRASVYELVEWANRNEAFVLSVDVPTGIDPTTGKVNIVDGSPLYIKPRYVVAMGAPKRGLLDAMARPADGADGMGLGNGESLTDDEEWRLFIADIGLGPRVWRKAGTKLRHGIDFQSKWVLGMRYQSFQDGDEDDDDE